MNFKSIKFYIEQNIPFFLLLLVGLGLRFWNINWGLPSLYEEAMPLQISWKFWNWEANGLDLNPHFFIYPGFTFYLQFVIQCLHYCVGHIFGIYETLDVFKNAYETDPTNFIIIARIVTIVFDAGIIVVSYLLGKKILDRRLGLLSAILISISVLDIKQAHLINVDTPLAFFAMLSVLFMHKLYQVPEQKYYLLAGICIGLATASKYNGALLGIAFIIVHLFKSSTFIGAVKSLFNKPLLTGIIAACLTFVFCNPYIILDFNEFYRQFSDVQTHMEKGHLGLDVKTSTVGYYFLESIPENLGWILTLIVLGSIVYLFIERKKVNAALLAFPIIYIGTIGSWSMRADRYIFPIIPLLLVIGAVGLIKFYDYLLANFPTKGLKSILNEKKLSVIGIIVIGTIAFPMFSKTIKYQNTLSLPDTRTLARQWLTKNMKKLSIIATGPFAIDIPKDTFIVVPIPFNAGNAEKTFSFYEPQWYEDIDLVITSDYDYGRYIQDKVRFSKVLRFYDTLKLRWKLAKEIVSQGEYNGPSFRFYQPPATSFHDSFDAENINNLELTGDSAEVINFMGKLGLALETKGKLIKSKQLLQEVIHANPKYLYALKRLVAINRNLEDYQNALIMSDSYLQQDPHDAEMVSLQADILFKMERYEESEQKFLYSLTLNEKQDLPYMALSLIYSAREDKKSVIEILTRYYSVLPQNSRKSKLVGEQLRQLLNSP